jgi:hypothetical protein
MTEKKVYRSDIRGDAFEASADYYSDLRDALGEAWRPIQQEAYESYCAWEAKVAREKRHGSSS